MAGWQPDSSVIDRKTRAERAANKLKTNRKSEKRMNEPEREERSESV